MRLEVYEYTDKTKYMTMSREKK